MLLPLLSFRSEGQGLTQDFIGRLEYDINYFTAFIKYDSCGDYTAKRALVKSSDYFEVSDRHVVWDSISSIQEEDYLRTKFSKDDQFIKLIYYNPTTNTNDTIDQFPLSKGDTITSCDDYLRYVDSLSNWNASDNSWHFWEAQLAPNFSETTNIGDTTITVLGQRYSCYRFEKFDYNRKSNPGPSHKRRIIYMDKASLFPIQEDWIYWYSKHPCKPAREWVLCQRLQLTAIIRAN